MSRVRFVYLLSLILTIILASHGQVAGAQGGYAAVSIADLVKQAREVPANEIPPMGISAGADYHNLLREPQNAPLPADRYNRVTVSSDQKHLFVWGVLNGGVTSLVVGIEGTTIQKAIPVNLTGLASPESTFWVDISTDLPPGQYYLTIGSVRTFIISKR